MAEDPARAEERSRLAHELHDIVSHHLANVTLRSMGRFDLSEADDLRAVLGEVHDAAGSALTELRLLARVLDERPGGAAEAVEGLSRDESPTTVAALWRRRLTEAGLEAEYLVPAASDHLDASVRATLARTFAATAQAMLEHTATRSRCAVTVLVEPTRVVVRATAAPPPSGLGTDLSEPGLRALAHRVDLLQGRIGATVSDPGTPTPRWSLTVVIPLD